MIGNIYYSSDTHYGSERTLTLSRRPFDNVSEMDRYMIKQHNDIVTPNDIVYHLGDFGDYSKVKELNGKIILILGNYEKKDIAENKITKEELLDLGFYDVLDNFTMNNFNADCPDIKNIYLVHEPENCIIQDDVFNLFGHIHKLQLVKRFGLNVGVDGNSFKPVSQEDVCFYMTAIKKFYDENVFM